MMNLLRPKFSIETRKRAAGLMTCIEGILRFAIDEWEWEQIEAKWMSRFDISIW